MKKLIDNLPRLMALLCAAVIVLIPFHAFLTVWASSLIGHYTALRLWKEVLLLLLFIGAVFLYIRGRQTRQAAHREPLIGLITIYIVLLIVAGLIAYLRDGVSLLAYLYGIVLDARFLVFFAITWVVSLHQDLLVRLWQRLLLLPAAVVVGFATLQYTLLPADFLKHFGYGPGTIPPSGTIDQKDAYVRIQSTLRGANPFGAYLVVVLSALGALLLRARRLDWRLAVMYLLAGLALVFTFSRSAWLGTFAATAWLVWLAIARSARLRRALLIAGTAGVLAFAAVG
ncbi:MAG TPA: hypothetical protein VK978_02510, partial [Candidatus Saccharimonadales bacterium]|nr:hypothetical protein [Candidatus Saccharimonadales bacterium]